MKSRRTMIDLREENRKKLIEVALPLDDINKACAREKSIRHGHPSTLHLWWARRPLAAARAVIFAQIVDDPSAHPALFPTEDDQDRERERLFNIIRDLVLWENTTNEQILNDAREELRKSWRLTCADNAAHPRAKELFDPERLPAFFDPFAGGGSLPLEAQRLGLDSYAADLNPVAVLINKSLIEIPYEFKALQPVNPGARANEARWARQWRAAHGLADDVRYYGNWMREAAERRIGHLYPKIEVTPEMANERADLRPYVGQNLNVVSWLWTRTVRSPNPAFSNVEVPLATTFMLSTKAGKEAYVEPLIGKESYRFSVRAGKPQDLEGASRGTKSGGSHSSFVCLMSGTAMPFEYLRNEFKAGRSGERLMAVIAEAGRRRIYLTPTPEMEEIAGSAHPSWKPEVDISHWPGRTNVVEYGLTQWGDLFTKRQLVALTTFSDLIEEVRHCIERDAIAAGLPNDATALRDGGTGAKAYAEALSVYLALAVDYAANYWSTIATPAEGFIRGTFARQAVPMTWDYAEAPPFGTTSGNWLGGIDWISKALESLSGSAFATAEQADAAVHDVSECKIVATDPPYYDNIGYADLSDFFYVWLRRSLRGTFPRLFDTVATPKADELVASAYRHNGKAAAEKFFLDGMTAAMQRLVEGAHPSIPTTIFYAFKQSETDVSEGTVSTGWETFLESLIRAGFSLTGTWPMRTERGGRTIGINSNALASSIVLVCRPRSNGAQTATRREFLNELKATLPQAVAHLQHGNIAPVDLAQAAIGPGMAVYTRYSRVLDADGGALTVRDALALINEVLDEVLAAQEGDFDAASRFAIAWFEQSGFEEGDTGVADVLARAKNTALNALVRTNIANVHGNKIRLLKPDELNGDWDPANRSGTVWETTHHLLRAFNDGGESAAASLVASIGSAADVVRELAYRLYTIAERKKRASDALSYNALVQSWPEIARLSRDGDHNNGQTDLFGGQ